MTPSRSRTTAAMAAVMARSVPVRRTGPPVACGLMERSAHGFWLADAGPVVARPVLAAREVADVAILGGGYLGMWTAWHLSEAGACVVLVDSDVCGHGPSGRNGGFVNGLWDQLAGL